MAKPKPSAFISYAREDRAIAERMYADLTIAGVDAWLDSKRLVAGHQWKFEIDDAIRKTKYFIAIISKNSVSKRGFVQRELKHALETLAEFPIDQRYLIPVRLDETVPLQQELRDLNWINLWPAYEDGLKGILAAIKPSGRRPKTSTAPATLRFAAYKSFPEYARHVLSLLPHDSLLFDSVHPIWIEFKTSYKGVVLTSELKAKFPDKMLLVFQHQFSDLKCSADTLSVSMSFSGQKTRLEVPYESITSIHIPSIKVIVHHEVNP